MLFKLQSAFKPAGDQPKAIAQLVKNIENDTARQILLGVTGSGKTFTMAHTIQQCGMPALILSPNKVLAAQLYSEFKTLFPDNAVEYFISYYDYYQPEAYIPQTDTYIEKDSSINEHIDRLRLKATTSLLSRKDVIVVASVSCIYNIGSPDDYSDMCLHLETGRKQSRTEITKFLTAIRYERNEIEFTHGKFRARGGNIDIFPPYGQNALRVEISADGIIASLKEINPLTGDVLNEIKEAWIYPAKHFVSDAERTEQAIIKIKEELAERLHYLKTNNKLLEAQRLEQRTKYDIEMLSQAGFCAGIENYSRHLSDRQAGERPMCLIDYFINNAGKNGFLLFIDESHVSAPQVRGMYEGDKSRKTTLIDFGFRLPSALDNRPLKFAEFEGLMPRTIFVSATPGPYELFAVDGKQFVKAEQTGIKRLDSVHNRQAVVEQIIRPTGLVDPPVIIHPSKDQIKFLVEKIKERAKKKERTLVLTLTKKTAQDLADYFVSAKIKSRYLHGDIETLERLEILRAFRKGGFDVLVGINLLREGIDIPEVSLVAILEADSEGFLRNETTLIQIAGRTARNVGGEVVLFADNITGSMERALAEMNRRRQKQLAYNKEHNITPKTIIKESRPLEEFELKARKTGLAMLHQVSGAGLKPQNIPAMIANLEKQMKQSADNLDFELAAEYRDRLFELKQMSAEKTRNGRNKKSD